MSILGNIDGVTQLKGIDRDGVARYIPIDELREELGLPAPAPAEPAPAPAEKKGGRKK